MAIFLSPRAFFSIQYIPKWFLEYIRLIKNKMDTTSSFVILKIFGPPLAPEGPKKLKKIENFF